MASIALRACSDGVIELGKASARIATVSDRRFEMGGGVTDRESADRRAPNLSAYAPARPHRQGWRQAI